LGILLPLLHYIKISRYFQTFTAHITFLLYDMNVRTVQYVEYPALDNRNR